ncbi:MAG: M14 family zinc carboxypeptidase [Actinomycetes bacterium]
MSDAPAAPGTTPAAGATPTDGRVTRRNLLKGAGLAGAALAATAAGPATSALGGSAPAAGAAAAGGASAEPLQLARVWAATPAQQALLSAFDDTHVVFEDGSIEVLLWPGDLARLRATGLRHLVTVEDVAARDAALLSQPDVRPAGLLPQPGETPNGQYRTLAQYEADMRKLAKDNPDICRLLELPFRTLEGRQVLGLEVCLDPDRVDGRPVFYNDGIHHAREWPAGELPIMWAHDLVEGYRKGDTRMVTIVENVRNIVVPVVNPDGFELSRSTPVGTGGSDLGTGTVGTLFGDGAEAIILGGQGRYQRKNRRSYLGSDAPTGSPLRDSPSVPKPVNADAYGIDPNRNYGYGWGGDGSSADQLSQTYRGTQPFSEQESQNVRWVFERYHCTASISHHTSGNLVLWAWGDTFDNAPDNGLLEGFGRVTAAYNGYRPQKSIQLYITTGTASDYMYGSRGSISYTFEHAGNAFHPAYLSTVPAMYEKNRPALLFLCEQLCLLPAQRPSYADLPNAGKAALATLGVRTDTLNHAVVRGKLPAAGEVRVTKRYPIRLWKQDGSGDENPLKQFAVEETVDSRHVTRADGSFELHLNPSTQPKVEFAGGREAYDISFVLPDGRGAMRRMVVERGKVVDLGTIAIG